MSFEQRLAARLARRRDEDLYRQRLTLESAQGPEISFGGRRYLNACSNDYLGLAAHPEVVARMQQAAARWGAGSGASHLICGHSTPHEELEQALAELTGRPRALLFSTGYMANIGIQTALLERGDRVLQDRLNHASLLDGGRFSGARFDRFRHNDTDDLERRLDAATAGETLVVADGVFSMDGDRAPLSRLSGVCREHGAWLMIDDAHGFGVLGAKGAGSVAAAGLTETDVPVYMATLGKALGGFGAFVAGSETLIEALIQGARTYIYTTAMPPAVAAANLAALGVMMEEDWRREHLRELIDAFRRGAAEKNLPLMASDTAIQPLLVGDSGKAMRLSAALRERGVLVTAIRPPTVPAGSARLRITLTAAHSMAQVESLLEQLAGVLRSE